MVESSPPGGGGDAPLAESQGTWQGKLGRSSQVDRALTGGPQRAGWSHSGGSSSLFLAAKLNEMNETRCGPHSEEVFEPLR